MCKSKQKVAASITAITRFNYKYYTHNVGFQILHTQCWFWKNHCKMYTFTSVLLHKLMAL